MNHSTSRHGHLLSVQRLGSAVHLQRRIGAGATGEVFMARVDVGTAELPTGKIAVKRSLEDPYSAELTEQEVQFLRRLRHPHIVEFFDAWQERASDGQRRVCIAMEYCDGGDLARCIREMRQAGMRASASAYDFAITVAVQVLSALTYCAVHNVIHRDIKPSNILLATRDRKRVVALGDFGIAKTLSASGSAARSRIGTPPYMAPEVLSGESYTHKSDVWSLGVSLFELLMLRRPFEATAPTATDEYSVMLDVIVCADPLQQLREAFDAPGRWLLEVIGKCLIKDPDIRPSAWELLVQYPPLAEAAKAQAVPIATPVQRKDYQYKKGPSLFEVVRNHELYALLQVMLLSRRHGDREHLFCGCRSLVSALQPTIDWYTIRTAIEQHLDEAVF